MHMSHAIKCAAAFACFVVSAEASRPTTSAGVTCNDPNSADGLTRAIDAALMELHGVQSWFQQLRVENGYPNALQVYSCTPDATKWQYPAASTAEGALARVLANGRLRVAGVQWKVPGAADYTTDPLNPTGFWPEYMENITATMARHYGVDIALERVYYDTSAILVGKVAEGAEVDMSEPYYYLSGFHGDDPRIEVLSVSCITAGIASKFYTPLGSGITNTDELVQQIIAGPNRAVGFIGQGNFDSVSELLPASTTPSFVTDNDDMAANVLSGALLAGYLSEGEPPNATLFNVFETGIISPRVALFHKDAWVCDEANGDAAPAISTALIVVAAITLVLALLLVFLVVKERMGKPVFMPITANLSVTAEKGMPQTQMTSAAEARA